MTKTPSVEIQSKALTHVGSAFSDYEQLSGDWRERMKRVYEAWSTFTQPRQSNWSTSLKVNKAHAVVEKVLPRIIAKNPKWIVSARTEKQDAFGEMPEEKVHEMAEAIQDYLSYIWEEYNLVEPARLWAKSAIIYGKSYAKVGYKYETARVMNRMKRQYTEEEYMLAEETGEELGEYAEEAEVTEEVIGEYPTIEVKSWTEVYDDPRYVRLCDRPALIELKQGVRLADLYKSDKYFNLDDVKRLSSKDAELRGDITALLAIAGIADKETVLDEDALTLKIYTGFFNKSDDNPKDERMYKICTVDDMVVIQFEEITQTPFEEIKCFEDPETAFGTGFVEPIMGLQDEMNFKKNSASEYINKALTRQMVWSPNSGIDPRSINDPVIVTDKDGQTAMANFVELPHRSIPAEYFQEQNDIERQIQVMTHTVDTSNPRGQQAMTNTATGIRVAFFESNSVIDEVRKHLEQGLQNLAYKLLQAAFENMEDNIVFKKMGSEGYWTMNKEALRNAVKRYSIRLEVNSSAYDYLENRRAEAMSLYQTLLQAKAQGENVQTTQALKDMLETFESIDPTKYVAPPDIQGIVSGLAGGKQGTQQASPKLPAQGASEATTPAASLTQQVAQGNITSAK